MSAQLGKNFIVTLLGVVLALGGIAWLADESRSAKSAVAASSTNDTAQSTASQSTRQSYSASETATQAAQGSDQSGSADADTSIYNEGYKAGYRDGQRDCAQSHNATAYRSYRTRRVSYSHGVAGTTYYSSARHHGHSTRNMILTIAAPAALGAGIGAAAGGGRGAGAGALIGGGAGALYYLIKHR